jgi:pSer/pThr/pTyr-binding forkhead associated (FHA) protein
LGFLRQIEKRMESLVEGMFGRAFRRQVHPVEIAKGLAKQMDEGSMVSVSRTYAPNDFTVHLSEADAESIRAYQSSLRDELIQYATTHAQSKNYHLMTPPRVRFTTEESLRFGEFGVTAKLTGGDGPRERGAPQDTSGQTRIFRTEDTSGDEGDAQSTAMISSDEAKKQGLARETVELVMEDGGKAHPLEGRGPWSVGRSEENDIVVPDPNVSRRHARLIRSENGFLVEDLGSTNGTLLDGAPIERERIESGDELTFGGVNARFIRRREGDGDGSSGPDFFGNLTERRTPRGR